MKILPYTLIFSLILSCKSENRNEDLKENDCNKLLVNIWTIQNGYIDKEKKIKVIKENAIKNNLSQETLDNALNSDVSEKYLEDLLNKKLILQFTFDGKLINKYGENISVSNYKVTNDCKSVIINNEKFSDTALIKSISENKYIIEQLGYMTLTFISQNSKTNFGCEAAVGHWKLIQRKNEELSEFRITKEGTSYIFNGIGHDGFLGRDYMTGLTCENDKLVMKGVPMMGVVEFTITDNGQTLLFKGGAYWKIDE